MPYSIPTRIRTVRHWPCYGVSRFPFRKLKLSSFNSIFIIPAWINIINWVVRTVGIQIQPVAPVGVLLSEAADDRVIEPGPQVILLGDGVDLLAVVGEAVGDGLLLDHDPAPGVVGIAVLHIAVFINDMGG